MPRDPRLYMTFPIDFHRHPKLLRLPAEVRWTFVEMNGEARIADNDGRFSAEDAEFMWPIEHLKALTTSHPTRPLVVREVNGGDYVIRDYPEHQQTKAEREALSAKRAEAGRKGGRSKAGAKHLLSAHEQSEAESESESESEDFSKTYKSQSSSERARVSTDAVEPSAMTTRLAAQRGVTSLGAVVDAVRQHVHREVTPDAAFQISLHLLDKAKSPRAPQRYVTGSIARSPFEVQKFIDDNALAVTA